MGISTKPECPYHERLDQKENKETKIWKKRKKNLFLQSIYVKYHKYISLTNKLYDKNKISSCIQ